MERLTIDENYCIQEKCYVASFYFPDTGETIIEVPPDCNCEERQRYDKLRQYELTGLTPDEIHGMMEDVAERGMCESVVMQNMAELQRYVDTGLTPDEVAEFKMAKTEGRVLPCKLGDDIFVLRLTQPIFDKYTVYGLLVDKNNKMHINIGEHSGAFWIEHRELGQSVFLTCEEAEAALKRRVTGNG